MVESGTKWGIVMALFMGEYRHNLDSKNRIIIPAKIRDALGDKFYLTKGYDGCISLYTEEKFEKMVMDLQKSPYTMASARTYMRELMSKSSECEVDSQGRIQLPQVLVKDAALQKACVIIGVVDHVEIWASDRWESYHEQSAAAFEATAESLTEFVR